MIGAKRGFTLIETLVALTLFSVIVTIGTDLFLAFQKTSRRTETIQALASDARFIIERVAREVREGMIDYPAYDLVGAINSDAALIQLNLRNAADETLQFSLSKDESICAQTVNPGCILLTSGSSSERLNAAAVYVRDAKFFIAPTQDPFRFDLATGTYLANIQPRVTILLSLTNGHLEGERDYMRYDVQTTLTSRVYRR